MFSFHLGPNRASRGGAPRKRRPSLWARQTVLNVGLVCLAAGAVGGKQLLMRFSAFALVDCQAPQVINLKLTDLYMSGGMTNKTFRVEWDGLPGYTFYVFRDRTPVGPVTTMLTNNNSVQHGVLLDTFAAQSGTTYTYSVEQVAPPPPPYSYGACNPTLSNPVNIKVVPVQAVVVDNQSVDARYDPRYALWTHLNHNFGSSATGQYVTNTYRGGLFAGYNGDNATVGHAYLSFPLPLLTAAGQMWPGVGSVNAFYLRSYAPGSTVVTCQTVPVGWNSTTLVWSNAPVITPANAPVVQQATVGTAGNGVWAHWGMSGDIAAALGSGAYGAALGGFNEPSTASDPVGGSATGWAYFSKKECATGQPACVLYAYGYQP